MEPISLIFAVLATIQSVSKAYAASKKGVKWVRSVKYTK